jgi:hypothetical protein
MRAISFSDTCQSSGPCHVYITLNQQASNELFVNFHLGSQSCTTSSMCYPAIYYKKADNTSVSTTNFSNYTMAKEAGYNMPDSDDSRKVYSTLLKNLEPDTLYEF